MTGQILIDYKGEMIVTELSRRGNCLRDGEFLEPSVLLTGSLLRDALESDWWIF